MRSRLLLARILSDEQDCSRLCLRDDIDEGMVGMEIDTTRLVGGEGGHRHDGSCDRSGFCSLFADLYLGLLKHFRDEEIAVGQMAELALAVKMDGAPSVLMTSLSGCSTSVVNRGSFRSTRHSSMD